LCRRKCAAITSCAEWAWKSERACVVNCIDGSTTGFRSEIIIVIDGGLDMMCLVTLERANIGIREGDQAHQDRAILSALTI